jgi:hypothetical protein
MRNSWWHSDPEEEGVRWFEIQEDEFMDAILDYENIFIELGIDGDRLDMNDMIDKWLDSVSRLH